MKIICVHEVSLHHRGILGRPNNVSVLEKVATLNRLYAPITFT